MLMSKIKKLYRSRRTILCLFILLEFIFSCQGQSLRIQRHGFRESEIQSTWSMDLQMPGFRPLKDDQYVCTSYEMPEDDVYIVQYEALADAGTAHHILLFGCDAPASTEKIWECGRVCNTQEQIVFAWAKNAPPLKLPRDVGFKVGSKTKVKNIVVQIHYSHKFQETDPVDNSGIRLYLTSERQKFVAGIYLLLAYSEAIPANTAVKHMDVSCKYDKDRSIFPFGYRTHAHTLGRVISGYQYNGTWQQIGKGNPQWPQAFYPVDNIVEVKKNDFMVARCTYNSTGRNRITYIGATGNDEMCNFYVMFYTDASKEAEFSTCAGNNVPNLVRSIPADSDKPLPANPALDMVAHGHNHHGHMGGSEDEPSATKSPVQHPSKPDTIEKDMALTFVPEWPKEDVKIGQVGGVATDTEGNLYVFHRAGRMWTALSFNNGGIFQEQTPITDPTIIVFDKNGHVIRKFGENRFYLPHGITVDASGNVWVTDVGLHQVIRFPKGSDEPDLELGQKLMPGNDEKHFCKPSDVAVLSTGEFFISDGYCNTRVMKFGKDKNLIKQWGRPNSLIADDGFPNPGEMNLVHSIAVAEDKGLICIADRENGRIQCFDLEGTFRHQMHPPEFGSKMFAIEYCPQHGGILFAVNGPAFTSEPVKVQGFTLNINTGDLMSVWNTQKGLQHPHDVTVDSVNHVIYVGELDPTKVWKFQMNNPPQTVPNTGIPHSGLNNKTVGILQHPDSDNAEINAKGPEGVESDDLTPSLIIGALLIIPVVLLIIITVLVRLYHSGKLSCCGGRRHGKKFNLGNFLNSHKGFDRLSTEESDHETDPLDDSDQEEYSIANKA